MSQKIGFPYFGLQISNYLFFIGLLLAVVVFFIDAVAPTQLLVLGFLEFLGVFLTGWALISYAVSKELLEGQRFIALLFALVALTGLFAVYLVHPVGVTFTV